MNSIVIKDGHTEWVLLVYSKEICMQHLYTIYSIQYWYSFVGAMELLKTFFIYVVASHFRSNIS